MNWDSDVEEEISEMEDPSEPDNNAIDDPDCQFSHDEEDSEDDSAGVPSSDENQETQQLSSTEGTWTSKDEKIILDMTNLEGRRVFQEKWKPLDPTDLHA
ncbi:hypothetical protein MHYP_G00123510 [Metynnis hypsauchen]